MYIFLNQNIYPNLSSHALAAYCSLCLIVSPNRTKICTTTEGLCFNLYSSFDYNKHTPEYIREGINELIAQGDVTLIEYTKRHWILDCKKILIDHGADNFTSITDVEINKIFNLKNVNNFLLLKYFIYLVQSFSSRTKVTLQDGSEKKHVVGNLPVSYLAQNSEISVKAIYEYNAYLEQLELIYIFRPTDLELHSISFPKNKETNIYGRFEDKKYVIKYVKEMMAANSQQYMPRKEIPANEKRRLSQMYNRITHGYDKNYSEEEITEIYEFIVSENEKNSEMFDITGITEFKDKIRSLDVFKKYDFIIMEV